MRVFYFLARHISYTFALSLFTVIGGWLGALFGFFLATSFLINPPQAMMDSIIRWLPVTTVIATLLHYLQFGIFTPFRIPAFFSSLRRINRNFTGDRLNPEIKDGELQELYVDLSHLPMHNMTSASFYAFMVAVMTIALFLYDAFYSHTLTLLQVKLVTRVIIVSVFVTVIFYGMSTYLFTEIITDRERARAYNELLSRGIRIYPRGLIGLRVKFAFFLVLMILTLLTFAALIEKSRFYTEADFTAIMAYFTLTIFAGFILMLVNTNSILRVLRAMSGVAKDISAGGETRFPVFSYEREFAAIEYAMMEMGDEIRESRKNLEMRVEQRTMELQSVLADLKERDDLIQRQLDMASTIQRSILPGHIDDWNELKFSVRYIAMEKIGGDFYDVFQLKDDKLGLMVADVSGHGIPAALVTTMAKISFGNSCLKSDSPRRIFQEVNQNILDHVKTQDYLTCFFVAIDDDYNVTYANASHQKALLLRTEEGRIEPLDTNGLFIGAVEEARETYEEKSTRMKYGDRLILYTDGIPEGINSDREEYSNERLEEVILKNRHLPLDDFTSYIIEDVHRFIGNAPIEDDITLLVIELARDEAVDIIKNSKKQIAEGKFYEAIDYLERGLALYPENRKLMYNLSKNYFRVNNFGKTVEFINRYIEKDKRNKYAYYIGGAAYFQMMDYKNSIDLFEEALRIDANFESALFALGMSYKLKGMKEDAAKCFERVVNLNADNRMAQFELGELGKAG